MILRKKRTIFTGGFIALLIVAGLAIKPGFAGDTLFPAVISEDLNGDKIALPAGIPGDKTLILLGFAHKQREDIQEWINGMKLDKSDLPWLEIPVIDDPGLIVRGFIRTGMRSGLPDVMRPHVVPVFTDQESFLKTLDIKNKNTVYAVVINRQGQLSNVVQGPYTPEAGEKIRRALLSR